MKLFLTVISLVFIINTNFALTRFTDSKLLSSRSSWIHEEIRKKIDENVSSFGELLVLEFSNYLLQNRYYIIQGEKVFQYRLEYDSKAYLKFYSGYCYAEDSCFVNEIIGQNKCSKKNASDKVCDDCYWIKLQHWIKTKRKTKFLSQETLVSNYYGDYWE